MSQKPIVVRPFADCSVSKRWVCQNGRPNCGSVISIRAATILVPIVLNAARRLLCGSLSRRPAFNRRSDVFMNDCVLTKQSLIGVSNRNAFPCVMQLTNYASLASPWSPLKILSRFEHQSFDGRTGAESVVPVCDFGCFSRTGTCCVAPVWASIV